MKISEIIIDPVQSTYERLLYPDAVALVEHIYTDLSDRSNEFTIPHRKVISADTCYEMLDALDTLEPVSNKLLTQYSIMLNELLHYLES